MAEEFLLLEERHLRLCRRPLDSIQDYRIRVGVTGAA
jgi:hypothetical protein